MNLSSHFSPEIWNFLIIPILIILARICDVSIGTVKIIFISKGLKHLAPIMGFFEVLIWLLAIGQIMQNLTNPINYFAYAAGFALGTFIGIQIENKLAMGISLIRVITIKDDADLIEHFRREGYSVTSLDAEGNRGPVKVFFTIVSRKELKSVVQIIKKLHPQAFYTIEDVSFVSQTLVPSAKDRHRLFALLGLKRK